MPTYVRWRQEGASYFFTLVAYRRQRIWTQALSRELLRTAIAAIRKRLPFEIPAMVLLPPTRQVGLARSELAESSPIDLPEHDD